VNQTDWISAYVAEIARTRDELGPRTLQTIFFGGGTPSLMAPETVAAVIDAVRAAFPSVNDIEITLEANPTSSEAEKFRRFAEAGVTRLSIGIQALNDDGLRRLGRQHSAAEARRAFESAREVFSSVSFDLIYARQNQSLAEWRAELSEALTLAVDHLSLYQLTIEDGTPFAARHSRGGLRGLPDEGTAADLYEMTQDICGAAGLPAYEVSNHARPGSESRHNLLYWRGHDWAGIGPGAHGRFTLGGLRTATEAHRDPARWLSEVFQKGNGESSRSTIAGQDVAEEYLMMSLRLVEGASLARFAALGGQPLDSARVTRLIDMGLVTLEADRLAASDTGRLLLNAVLRDLLA
jgi:oxygen-independent coproporphyrinogen-3 oxidase